MKLYRLKFSYAITKEYYGEFEAENNDNAKEIAMGILSSYNDVCGISLYVIGQSISISDLKLI